MAKNVVFNKKFVGIVYSMEDSDISIETSIVCNSQEKAEIEITKAFNKIIQDKITSLIKDQIQFKYNPVSCNISYNDTEIWYDYQVTDAAEKC